METDVTIRPAGMRNLLMPRTLQEAMEASDRIAKSAFCPKEFKDKAGDVFCAISMGSEVGLSPFQALQSIAVINGRPSIWGDAALGLVEASGLLESITETFEGESEQTVAVCTVKRRGREPLRREFSVTDAKRAQLWAKAGVWTQYPKRMLQMRARSWALRDGFADVLKGLSVREEAIDITPEPERVEREPIAMPERLSGAEPTVTVDVALEKPDTGNGEYLTQGDRAELNRMMNAAGMSYTQLRTWLKGQGVQDATKIPRELKAQAEAFIRGDAQDEKLPGLA